jgi:hypothetical protein
LSTLKVQQSVQQILGNSLLGWVLLAGNRLLIDALLTLKRLSLKSRSATPFGRVLIPWRKYDLKSLLKMVGVGKLYFEIQSSQKGFWF